MSSVAVYSSRSRASERQRNIRNDMNRASAYIMNNDYTNDYASNLLNTSSTLNRSSKNDYSSSKITRRPRDSSLGALGRPNRESSLTRTGTYTRDSSLPRFKEPHIALKPTAPTSLITSIISNRHSIALPSVPILDGGLGSETAKFQRQNELKEIHNSFMKGFKDTNNKLNGDIVNAEEQADRRSKAYAKIIGDQSNYSMEQEYQRQNYSDMFIDTGKFTTRTLSAIKNLDGTAIKKKTRNPEEYQWRKDMEQYEKSSEYEKEKRIRNIANPSTRHNLKDDTEGKENQKNLSIQNRSRNALFNINNANKEATSKPPQSPKTKPKPKETPKPAAKIESKPATASKITKPVKPVVKEEVVEPPTPARKTWREKVAEQEKEELEEKRKAEELRIKKEEEALKKENETLTEEEKAERDDAKAMARAVRERIEAQLAEQFPIEPVKKPKSTSTEGTENATNSENTPKEGGDTETGEAQQEEEDSHGTKQMKSDFDAKMLAMEQEMSAGRSKLAKLRERIRKAKGTVKEADKALDDSKNS